MTISWFLVVAVTIKNVVLERELRLRLVMRVMGLEMSPHWIAWFLTIYPFMLLSATLIVLVLKVRVHLRDWKYLLR